MIPFVPDALMVMIRNYLLVTTRNIFSNKLFSFINVIGLAIGLTACFMIWQYVRFESSYDSFHEHASDLYRVTYHINQNGRLTDVASNVPAVGHAMEEEFPEVKASCRLVKTSLFTSDLGKYFANALEFSYEPTAGNLVAFNEEKVWFADGPFLSMFTFPIIAGSEDALSQPNTVVITESIAKKYFGQTPALGRTLRLNRDMMLKVTGVIQDVPVNSHLQFDILISFATLRPRLGDLYDNWGWAAFYTYVLLTTGADVTELQGKLPQFKERHAGKQDGSFKTSFQLQKIQDIHLKSNMQDEQSPTSSERTVYFLSILSVFILIVAWINYINLSTAKALERSKEVGLRKTVGATKGQLISQFLTDTVVINLLAVFISVILIIVSWRSFETLVEKQLDLVFSVGGFGTWVIAGLVFIAGVLISGLYPATKLSSFNPALVLKGKFHKTTEGSLLRKSMIAFQYIVAALLIAGTLTIYLQLAFMRSMDTGFTRDQVLVVESPAVYDSMAGPRISLFKNGVSQIPGVTNVSAVSDVPGRHIVENSPISRKNANNNGDYFHTSIPSIDTSFFATFDITIITGRLFEPFEKMDFRRKDENEAIPVLVNEAFVKRMNIDRYEDALNEDMLFYWGPDERSARIIGVVSDHHQVSFKDRIQPVMYMQPAWHATKYFAIRLKGGATSNLSSIQLLYDEAFPDHPFSWFFLDEHFDLQYRDDQQFGRIFNVFTGLALLVTCLGLLGLSVFSMNQRKKEMGIRKALGASSGGILLLFVKEFMRVLITSYVIALPIIYWASNNWLDNFSFRVPLPWQIFTLPLLALFMVSLLTIALVTAKAAIETPVKALRQE